MSEGLFREEVEAAVKLYEKAIRYHASRTRQMIAELGEIETLSRLMISPDLQKGFKVLRDRKQLEAIVIRYREFFQSDAIEAAQWRLDHPNDLL